MDKRASSPSEVRGGERWAAHGDMIFARSISLSDAVLRCFLTHRCDDTQPKCLMETDCEAIHPRGALAPVTPRSRRLFVVFLGVLALATGLDYVFHDGTALIPLSAFVLVLTLAAIGMQCLSARFRREYGVMPPTSATVGLAATYAGAVASPVGVLGALWLDFLNRDDPLLQGAGPLMALIACALPLMGLAWSHWHSLSTRPVEADTRASALQELDRLAHEDALTGLPNRRAFDRRLSQMETNQSADGALLLIDLDHFKQVNDKIGHHAGDALLQEIANRLKASVREFDFVARLGGDEFAVVLEGPDSLELARMTAARIGLALGPPFRLGTEVIQPAASIGFAALEAGRDTATALKQADEAMYRAKRMTQTAAPVKAPAVH